jgi:hypothetical protein
VSLRSTILYRLIKGKLIRNVRNVEQGCGWELNGGAKCDRFNASARAPSQLEHDKQQDRRRTNLNSDDWLCATFCVCRFSFFQMTKSRAEQLRVVCSQSSTYALDFQPMEVLFVINKHARCTDFPFTTRAKSSRLSFRNEIRAVIFHDIKKCLRC